MPTALRTASPGSSSGSRLPSRAVRSKYHQGMPLVTKATAVSGPSSGAMPAATERQRGHLGGDDHRILRRRAWRDRRWRAGGNAACRHWRRRSARSPAWRADAGRGRRPRHRRRPWPAGRRHGRRSRRRRRRRSSCDGIGPAWRRRPRPGGRRCVAPCAALPGRLSAQATPPGATSSTSMGTLISTPLTRSVPKLATGRPRIGGTGQLLPRRLRPAEVGPQGEGHRPDRVAAMAEAGRAAAELGMQAAGDAPEMHGGDQQVVPPPQAARRGIDRRDGAGMAVEDQDAADAGADQVVAGLLDHRLQVAGDSTMPPGTYEK